MAATIDIISWRRAQTHPTHGSESNLLNFAAAPLPIQILPVEKSPANRTKSNIKSSRVADPISKTPPHASHITETPIVIPNFELTLTPEGCLLI